MPSETKHTNVMLANFTITRLVVSTAFRMMFPFLPVVARGLGVSVESIALIVSARSALGVTAPFLGSIADYTGRKTAMLSGLGLFAGGLLIIAILPSYGMLAAGLLLSSLGMIIIDSTIYATIGDSFPYEKRGRAIAIVESGWSGAFIIGIPIVGWLIANGEWYTPFKWLALAGFLIFALLFFLMPKYKAERGTDEKIWDGLRSLLGVPAARAILLFSVLILFANSLINIIFGVWLEDVHHLSVEGLGSASTVLGFAGIGGVVLVALFADRIGKRRAISIGLLVNILFGILLPIVSTNLTVLLISLFFFYLTFEFTLTSSLPLMTEIVPAARATLMATNVAAIALGDALGASIGPFLFQWGIIANTGVSILLNIFALIILIFFVKVSHKKPLIAAVD